jgi:hypothetical protein
VPGCRGRAGGVALICGDDVNVTLTALAAPLPQPRQRIAAAIAAAATSRNVVVAADVVVDDVIGTVQAEGGRKASLAAAVLLTLGNDGIVSMT